jgi:hypothetical protein
MKLYQISQDYLEALSLIEENDYSDETIQDTLEGITGVFEDKAINVAAYIKNLEAECEAMKDYEKTMAERRKNIERKIEGLKKYLSHHMEVCNVKSIHSTELDIIKRKTPPAVQIVNEEALPEEYWVTTRMPDKHAIKEDLKRDILVPGVALTSEERIYIK